MGRILTICCLAILSISLAAPAQYVQVGLPLERLPEEHPYQKKMRAFLATLMAKDFDVERRQLVAGTSEDPDELYRLWLLSQHMHNVSAAMLPAEGFTLRSIEGAKGLVLPCTVQECQMLAWLATWDHPGNTYRGMRALKLRACALAMTEIAMLDYLYEHNPQGANRADFLGGNLIWLGYTYRAVKDVLPADARAAMEAGLKKLVLTIDKWGPRGLMTDMDLFAPVGLRYIADAMDDPQIKKIAAEYSRRLFTEPRFFHPAGYFVDNGCFDTSYNGISLYFASWAAVMSDWKFARDALDKAYRLRAHLSFPHPDKVFSGPSAMASRCSSDPPRDQWQFPPRAHASAMVTDEALHVAPMPTPEQMKAAASSVIAQLNKQLAEPRKAQPQPWKESHWSGAMNFAAEFYPKGHYERRRKLSAEGSPLTRPLYLRDERFVREFAKAFVIARLGHDEVELSPSAIVGDHGEFAAAIHTGPVGGIHKEWQRPYGFGGGALCAYWTPATGPVILGRRRGLQGHVYDAFAEWRLWPVHAVTGLTDDGGILSSSRIEQPEVDTQCGASKAQVRVAGLMPKYVAAQKRMVPTSVRYQRVFLIGHEGLSVVTQVANPATPLPKPEGLVELYETIPLFLREIPAQKPATIHFLSGDDWVDATPEAHAKVRAVAIKRVGGEVQIRFADPVTVRLSPSIWKDGFQTQAECRTLLIDLLPRGMNATASVSYTIVPVRKKARP